MERVPEESKYRRKERGGGREPPLSPAGGDLSSVATPKQARSEATLQRLLDAAEALICERGFAAVSIGELVRSAASSVGGFYARFRDKDELLRALNERHHVRLASTLEVLTHPVSWEGVSLPEMVRTLLSVQDAEHRGRQKLLAAVLEATARDPGAWQGAIAFRARVIDAVAGILLMRRDEIRHPDPERAVRFALSQALAVSDQRAMYSHIDSPGLGEMDDETTRQELERSILGYLTYDQG